MIVQLLTEHHLEFLSLKGGCRGLSESTHVKMSNCWKSHSTAHFPLIIDDVEEMEASYDTATSPGANESLTSTSTVRSAGLSPSSLSSPKTPPKIASPVSPTVSFKPRIPGSPSVKIPCSPTVKISKSAVSSYAGSDVICLTQTGSQIANERSPVKDVKENEPVDLTESDDNMETDADADISSSAETADENPRELRQGRQVREIFEKDEEISGEGEIEEMDLVTSSTGKEQVVVDQEDAEHDETDVKIEQEEVIISNLLVLVT